MEVIMAVGLSREKGHRWLWGPAYKGKSVLGSKRTLSLLLTSSWVLQRLARELAAREVPHVFHFGLTDERL